MIPADPIELGLTFVLGTISTFLGVLAGYWLNGRVATHNAEDAARRQAAATRSVVAGLSRNVLANAIDLDRGRRDGFAATELRTHEWQARRSQLAALTTGTTFSEFAIFFAEIEGIREAAQAGESIPTRTVDRALMLANRLLAEHGDEGMRRQISRILAP